MNDGKGFSIMYPAAAKFSCTYRLLLRLNYFSVTFVHNQTLLNEPS